MENNQNRVIRVRLCVCMCVSMHTCMYVCFSMCVCVCVILADNKFNASLNQKQCPTLPTISVLLFLFIK